MALITLLARILLSLIFILSGLHKVADFSGTVSLMTQHGLPAASLLAVLAIAVEVGGGLSVLLGFQARLAAVVLLLFLIPTTLVFHSNLVVPQVQDQTTQLLKNLAIMGGLLMLAAHGPGAASLDARRRRPASRRLL
jgi:putative oxidoreductase